MSGRVKKSIINAEVNLLFYFLSLFFAFFSRKIFLDQLGDEFIGLTGTLGNILGYLNLAELGIGSCISFFLFKPLQSGNREQINEIMSLFGYLYRWIGRIIFGFAVVISAFFPLIFKDESMGYGIIYFAFYSFLGSSLIGYFINYRQILLSADQKNYVVSVYMQSAGLVRIGLQILLAYTYSNPYVWVAIELLFGIFGCIVLNWKINKEYPWLRCDKSRGNELRKKYPEILRNTRQIFIHQIKDFALSKSDELFVFAFVSLKMVAFYGNYTMIVTKVALLFKSALDAVGAGIGNLVAEGNKANIMKVFWEMQFVRHFVAGLICFAIYHLIEPFICIWLGPEYVMDHTILVLLVIYTYIGNSRGVVDMYNHAYGLYADVWSAWTELIINIGVTVVCGSLWGIIGILLGKIVSVFFIVIFWKPYYLFRSGLKESYGTFWAGTIVYYIVFGVSFTAATLALRLIPVEAHSGYLNWVLYSAIAVVIYIALNFTGLYLFAKGSHDFVARITNKLRRK